MSGTSYSTSWSADRPAGAFAARRGVILGGVGLALLLLAGCGFQLRGGAAVEQAGAVHVVALRRVPMQAALERALTQAGSTLVEDRARADVVVELAEQTESRRTLSFTERASAAEYEYTLALRYRMVARDGGELVPERRIESTRSFRIDRDNLAASSEEEALLREELGADLVQQVVRSLAVATRARHAAGA